MRSLNPLFLVLALALAATTGCSFSDSSGSISDSISSPSESLSDSSGSSSDDDSSDDDPAPAPETPQDTASYRQDVSQLAVTYLKSGGELPAFTSAIANLAQARGITDWEADPDTTQAIGVGAGTAGLDEAAFNDFGQQLFGDDLTKLNDLRIGYQATAPSTPAVAAPVAEDASQPEAKPGA
jgi:hypothetical protein